VLSMYDALNTRQLDRLDDVIAPHARFHLAHLPEPLGRDQVKADMAAYQTAFPDLEITIEEVVASGDHAAVRLVAHGAHQGEFGGIDPTQRTIAVTETDFLHLEGGQVVEAWVLYDQFSLMAQLGVLGDLAAA
jgi:predicted ester cyclase